MRNELTVLNSLPRKNSVSLELQANTINFDSPAGRMVTVLESTRCTIPDVWWLACEGIAGECATMSHRAISASAISSREMQVDLVT
jgi:hypothetical protein